jgi:hypothetical protein
MSAGVLRLIAVLAAVGADTGVSSTAEQVMKSASLPANFWTAGKVVKLTATARVTAANSTDTWISRLRIGPTTLTGTAVATSGTAADATANDLAHYELTITCRSVGTAGELMITGTATAQGAEGTATARVAYERITSYDTTIAQLIEMTGQFSVSNAGNTAIAETWALLEAA